MTLVSVGAAQIAPPSLTSISPSAGAVSGGTALTLSGSNFQAGAVVTLGGNSATNVIASGDGTTITALTPANNAGAVDVTVINPDGQSSTLSGGYTYNPAPTLASISPSSGSTNGGTSVTLSGSNFLTGATVTFGSLTAGNVVVVNSGSITAATPPSSAGTVNVTVTNPDGQSATLFGLVQPLTNPGFESGSAGWFFSGSGSATVITNSAQAHSGNNFVQLTSPAGKHPLFNAILASGNSQYMPVNPGDVITFGGWASRLSGDGRVHWVLSVTDANKANPVYATASNVTSSSWTFSQNSYTVGSTGRFARLDCEIFSNTVSAVANFDDAIFIRSVLGSGFTYLTAVSLGWIGPPSAPANTSTPVYLSGANFFPGASVSFGGVPATNVTVVKSTIITAMTPPIPAGSVPVVVTNLGGQTSAPVLTYTFNPPPAISSVTPSSGSLLGGSSITISGTNFLPGAKLTVGGTAALNISTSASTITATTSAHPSGLVDIVVTNPDGQSATASAAYTYGQPPPSIATLTPVSGSTNGGTLVVVAGANFLLNPTVGFGGAAATVVSANAGVITVAAPPAGSAGPVDLTVTNADGQFAVMVGGFNYVTPTPAPTVTSISSPSGPTSGGASLTINGTNFVSGATVTFGGTPATSIVVANSATITAVSPPHASGRVNVTVINPDGQSASLLGVISMLPNPDFEEGSTDWQLAGTGGATISLDPPGADAGDQYLVLSSSTGSFAKYFATDSSGVNPYFPVAVGDVISFGGSVYRVSGDGLARFSLVVSDANKNVMTVVYTSPGNVVVPLWAHLLGTYTVPPGAAFIQLAAQIDSNLTTAQARFDNAILQRMPAGTGYNYVGPNLQGIYTHHYDNARTGQNTNETTLTPANVNRNQFGKKFFYPVDGWIHAQPVYVANVTIGGAPHNVVYVATEHDSVYAFDADGKQNTPLWQTSFINPSLGITTVAASDIGSANVGQPEFGVLASPVIDPVAGTLFVLARSKENGSYFHRLHALDITTGLERPGSPVVIQVSVTGTGLGSVGSQLSYDPLRQNVRPGLVLANGTVYFASASLLDTDPYHGWVVGYDSHTLSLAGVYNTTPNGTRGGIWQSGSGIAADAAGALYVETGNGTFDANLGGQDYGDSILKIQQSSAGLQVVDFFTPFNQAALSSADLDLASGAIVLLPDQPGPHPHELIGGGKQGTLYVLDRDAMGGYNAAGDTQIIQALPGALPSTTPTLLAGLWSTPTYWNNRVYFTGRGDFVKMFTLQNGLLSGPISKGRNTMNFMTSVVSSNGVYNGILWVCQNDGSNTLRAFNPDDLTSEYYDTAQAGTRDVPGGTTRFSVPLVVNGNVYLGTKIELEVYGLLTLPATLASIAVTPANASVTAGTTSSLTATGTYSDGTTQNVTGSVTWATTNSGIATVNAQGVATGVSPGNITVSATSGAITGSAGLTVTPATLVSVALSPQVTGIAVGATQQFIATGNYSDGSTQNLTNSLTWNSSNPAVATVNTGLATAVSAGTAVISATSGATVGSANLSVGQIVLQSIAVTPANPTIALGTTQQLSATGTYSDNSTLDVTNSATWSVSNNAVVSVNPGGVATALGIGSASVKAALGSISNSITITGYLGPIPSSFFGLHVNTSASNVTVPYGRCRIWGVQGTLWRSIEASQGVYNFASLDGTLAAAKLAGINDGCVFTFGSVPPWASTNPADNTCDKPGSCWPPADLNFDGSGTDQTIIDALTNIATHVNDPIYLQTHAHIKYWEPWNETYRGTFIGAYGCTSTHTCSFNGSYAQLVRIAEEMRCIIKGSGSVNSVPCTNAGIDPSASIITPSGQAYIRIYGRQEVPNFLQCNQNPLAGSGCSTGSRGSAAVDVVNYHCYVRSGNADDVAGYIALSRALLTPVDAAKPFYCDEGSWGPNTSFPDPDLQAGFTARWFTDILSEQVTTALWFTWDNQGWGTLWNPDGRNGCTQTAGCMTKAGVAYAQTYNWLIGANLQGCLSSNGITVCTLSRANGYSALMIWSTATLTSCIGQISSEVCGSTTYQVPSGYITKRDLDGLVQPANPTEYVGAKPILLENH